MNDNKKYPIVKHNDEGREIYREEENGYWVKREYDEKGRQIYWETNRGGWAKHKFDDAGNEIFYENSDGFWFKAEYNQNGFRTHYEDSTGKVQSYRDVAVDDVLKDAQERSNTFVSKDDLSSKSIEM